MPTNRLLVKEEVAVYTQLLMDALKGSDVQHVLDIRSQLEQMRSLLRGNADLRDALVDEEYTPEQHRQIATNVFAGFDPLAVSVLATMAERGETARFSAVVDEFCQRTEDELGITVVDVTTVVELDDDLRAFISDKLSKDLGKKVVLREHIDPSILGGIIMSTHGKRIDASVASRLEVARNVLKESNDGGER